MKDGADRQRLPPARPRGVDPRCREAEAALDNERAPAPCRRRPDRRREL